MPITFKTCPDLNLLYGKWWGHVNINDFRANFARFLADEHYKPGRPELIDLSEITNLDFGFDTVRQGLSEINRQVPGDENCTCCKPHIGGTKYHLVFVPSLQEYQQHNGYNQCKRWVDQAHHI